MKKLLVVLGLLWLPLASHAEVDVDDVWVRATVARQTATGAFMRLRAERNCRLVAAASPLAGVTEIHQMVLEGDVMKMSPIDGLGLPAGKTVELKPGGYHLMLLELKQALRVGDRVPLSIEVECEAGERRVLELDAEVRPLNAMPASGGSMKHRHH